MPILSFTISAFWSFFPAGAANMAPILAAKIFPSFNYPMDAYMTFRGKRVLGEHKTVRGLIAGVVMGELFFLLQRTAFVTWPSFSSVSLYDFQYVPWFSGLLLGFGAIMGDALKSFFKRQLAINPGKPWFVFDQIDWILGTLIAISPWIRLPLQQNIGLVLLAGIFHIIFKIVGRLTGFNSSYI